MTSKIAERLYLLERDLGRLRRGLMDTSAETRAWSNLVSLGLALPGLVEFWPFSSSAGGLGRGIGGAGMHLTNNGPVVFTHNGLAPLARFLHGAYFSRADEAALRVTGAEAYIHSSLRGLTFMVWVAHNNAASAIEYYFAKALAAGDQRSFQFWRAATGTLTFTISSNGTSGGAITITSTDAIATGYNFIAARFKPSTSLDIFINDSLYSETTGVPASIFASTAQFCVGGDSAGGNTLLGNMSGAILCAMALPDAVIQAYYHATRSLFGL